MRKLICVTTDVPVTSEVDYCGAFQEVDNKLYVNHSLYYDLSESIGKHLHLVDMVEPNENDIIIHNGKIEKLGSCMERSSGFLGFYTESRIWIYYDTKVQKIIATSDTDLARGNIHSIPSDIIEYYVENSSESISVKTNSETPNSISLNYNNVQMCIDLDFWEEEMTKCKNNPYYFAKKYIKEFNTEISEVDFNSRFKDLTNG